MRAPEFARRARLGYRNLVDFNPDHKRITSSLLQATE